MKAYRLDDVQRYSGWRPVLERTREWSATFETLAPDSIVYLREDLALVTGCSGAQPVLFASAAPEWKRFCREELEFEVPDWEAESIRLRAQPPVAQQS
jgi:hypothetical protein